MTFKRFVASTGHHNLIKKYGVISAMGQNYNFEACFPLNKNLEAFIFPGIEWIPKAIRDKAFVSTANMGGEIRVLARRRSI